MALPVTVRLVFRADRDFQMEPRAGSVLGKILALPVRASRRRALAGLAIALLAAWPAWPQETARDLGEKSIEDLMNIEVTSVSRTEQKLSRTPSAIFVITRDDIRWSGATSIPDVLRMVPGMNVAQMNGDTWAITARGMNKRFGHDLLVMMDGHAFYSPTFGGVFWEVLDTPLENIERIEVIRGPGGSIWGANAVNGVVNILTRKASETQGVSGTVGGGNIHQGFGTLQYGGQLGKSTFYRAYVKYLNEVPLDDPQDGRPNGDGWHNLRAGFRADTTLSAKDSLFVEGNTYSGREGLPGTVRPSVTSPFPVDANVFINLSGGFVQGTWTHQFSPRSATSLNLSYNRYERTDDLDEDRGAWGITFQHNLTLGERHEVVWGIDYRHSSSDTTGSFDVSLHPPTSEFNLISGFVQDQIALVPERLFLTLGTKLERHYYSGFGVMPSARLAWVVNPRNTLWAAVSRALRTPSDVDVGLRVNLVGFPGPGGTPSLLAAMGDRGFTSEKLLAYEAGYRASIRRNLSFDLAAYYNRYGDQATAEPGPPFFEPSPGPPHFVFPLFTRNLMTGESHGLEVFVMWKPTGHWTISPGYAFERIHMSLNPASLDRQSLAEKEGNSPAHSAELRSHYALSHGLAWDVSAYFVGRLAAQGIPSYTRLDTQLSWQTSEDSTLSVVGQNLLTRDHLEFADATSDSRSSLMKRGGYVKFTWRF